MTSLDAVIYEQPLGSVQVLCQHPDLSSNNEMYRIHKSGDNRCAQNSVQSPGQVHEHNGSVHESFQSFTSAVISSNLVYESASFECPSCGKVFRSSKLLQEHIDYEHAEENSRTSLTLQSVADNSDWMYAKCTLCEKRFQTESDMEFHVQRFHEYGEECALYPCELCGYRGQDVDALRGHISEYHEENTEKSSIHIQDSPEVVPDLVVHKRIVQNLKGIDFDEDSDDDIEWTPTKNCSEAEILFSCNFCEFQTKYPNNLERHKQLHQNNKKRKKENTTSHKGTLKKQKIDVEESFLCDFCCFIFNRKGNLKRHQVNKHGK